MTFSQRQIFCKHSIQSKFNEIYKKEETKTQTELFMVSKLHKDKRNKPKHSLKWRCSPNARRTSFNVHSRKSTGGPNQSRSKKRLLQPASTRRTSTSRKKVSTFLPSCTKTTRTNRTTRESKHRWMLHLNSLLSLKISSHQKAFLNASHSSLKKIEKQLPPCKKIK